MHQVVSMLCFDNDFLVLWLTASITHRNASTYCVMADSSIAVSVSLLIAPNMHHILNVLWLIAP